jgi:hypothetical protein
MTSATVETDHVFATAGKTTLELDLYRAPQTDAPLVLYVHGGGWHSGDKADARADAIFGGALMLSSPGERPPTYQWLVGAAWIVLGVAVLAQPSLSVEAVAVVVGVALIVNGPELSRSVGLPLVAQSVLVRTRIAWASRISAIQLPRGLPQ